MPLSRRLNELITETGALMEYLGCSSQAISQYKLGTSKPTLENLCKIADFYGVTTDYLLGRTETKSPDADIQAAQEYTGLSERAINLLHAYVEADKSKLRILSDIISAATFPEILTDIDKMCRIFPYIRKGINFSSSEPIISGAEKAAGYHIIDRYEYYDLLKFKICNDFSSIAEVICAIYEETNKE